MRILATIEVVSVALGALAVYLAALATWSVARDETLERPGKAIRLLLAWVAPIVAPIFFLRAAAEFSPQTLPALRLLWPVRWLLTVHAPRGSDGSYVHADGTDGSWGLESDHFGGGR
jgi:hypothetical protein